MHSDSPRLARGTAPPGLAAIQGLFCYGIIEPIMREGARYAATRRIAMTQRLHSYGILMYTSMGHDSTYVSTYVSP